MRKNILTLMVSMVALFACNKGIEFTPDSTAKESAGKMTFTATVEGVPESKATFDETYKCAVWEEGDRISINGKEYSAQEAGTTTCFKADGDDATGDTYSAFFPASLDKGSTKFLPYIQKYDAGKFDMPMYAVSTTTELEFKNLCAVLAIKVTSADIATLKSIKLTSDRKMNGTFTVSGDKAVMGGDGTNAVVLESPEALTLDEAGTTFYIAIPAQEYKYLNIFLSSDGTAYSQAMATNKAAGLGTIARSKMLHIDYAKNATKLWAGNIFFANWNLGATSATEYGGYYYWGGTANQELDPERPSDYDLSFKNLEGDKDTATKLWGRNWRMPTGAEFQALINDCTCTWTSQNSVNGLLCTGKGNYASCSIFLPAAGGYFEYTDDKNAGDGGPYWSASVNENEDILRLYFNSSELYVQGVSLPNYGYPIRAVLNE